MRSLETDVLVVGSGIAGLTFALKAAEHADVLLLTKKDRVEATTNYAQGGVAAVVSPDDAVELHVRDTLLAGAGLCHRRAVEELAREGPERVRELVEWGVRFSRGEDGLALGREAGHSRRRILHAADLTGREIERALLAAAAAAGRIQVLEDHFVARLVTGPDAGNGRIRCTGALALDVAGGRWVEVCARAVLLATGGCGRLYRHTTNPDIAAGDGVALGYEAGATVANLEFMQFHPTALHPAGARAFLISEAVRGEGAVLRLPDGEPFMERHHPAGSLAPRDVVARAVRWEMNRHGVDHVLLDASSLDAAAFAERFPTIHTACRARGIDPPADPMPVVPAAHYQCGGLLTDWDGRTSVAGLYAAGEVACTGAHGANRLASNSLLEAVVFAHRTARRLRTELPGLRACLPRGEPPPSGAGAEPETVERELRALMWEEAGLVRSDAGLARARRRLDELLAAGVGVPDTDGSDPAAERQPAESSGAGGQGRGEAAMRAREVVFLLQVASLVVRCAARRLESRGLHYTESHPYRDSERFLRDTVLVA